MEIAFFKRLQHDNVFHYYKVFGGPGKTVDGYQEVINFLNEKPIISIEHNLPFDKNKPEQHFEITGTWCTYEVGMQITEQEYIEAFKKATTNTDFSIR